MRTLLFAGLLSFCAVPSYAQLVVKMPMQSVQVDDATLRVRAEQLAQLIDNLKRNQAIEQALGGLAVTADKMDLDVSGKRVRASGNVRIKMNEVTIAADDAVIENGDIQLGANAHVVLHYPVKMIQ